VIQITAKQVQSNKIDSWIINMKYIHNLITKNPAKIFDAEENNLYHI